MFGVPALKTYEATADCTGPKRATVTVRDLAIEVDAPEGKGGKNSGLTPVEYLLGSLAGCFNVTGSAVAAEIGLDLTIESVSVSGELDTTTYLTGEGSRAGYRRLRVSVSVDVTVSVDDEP
jgi:uncharacterized OsmC-like protein